VKPEKTPSQVEDYCQSVSPCVSLRLFASPESLQSLSRLSLLLPHLQTRAEERGFLEDKMHLTSACNKDQEHVKTVNMCKPSR
jgi:hypothetical protein